MTSFGWSLFLLAAAAGLGGLYMLYAAWKRPGRPFHVLGGWGLLIAALAGGLIANGDRGLAQISVIVMVAACIYLAVPMMRGLALPVADVRALRVFAVVNFPNASFRILLLKTLFASSSFPKKAVQKHMLPEGK